MTGISFGGSASRRNATNVFCSLLMRLTNCPKAWCCNLPALPRRPMPCKRLSSISGAIENTDPLSPEGKVVRTEASKAVSDLSRSFDRLYMSWMADRVA